MIEYEHKDIELFFAVCKENIDEIVLYFVEHPEVWNYTLNRKAKPKYIKIFYGKKNIPSSIPQSLKEKFIKTFAKLSTCLYEHRKGWVNEYIDLKEKLRGIFCGKKIIHIEYSKDKN